jgi:5'-nucleotidase/UDP-sugar diphosphatase
LTADSYMLEFIGILKKMSFGLVNVVPKDKTGNPIKDMKTSMIDMDPGKPGIQEGKQWTALLNYVRSFPTLTSIAVPDIPETYRKYTPRIIPLEKRK